MKKYYLALVFMAALLQPLVSQSQESLTVADDTTLHANVPLDFFHCTGSGAHRAWMLYPDSLLTSIIGKGIDAITFYHQYNFTKTLSSSTWYILMGTTTDTNLSNSYSSVPLDTVYAGDLRAVDGVFTFEFPVAFFYTGGTLIVKMYTTGAVGNWFGWGNMGCYGMDSIGSTYSSMSPSSPHYTFFLPKTTFHTPSCFKIRDLIIDDSLTTPNSMTLSWRDANNTGATYSVYDMNSDSIIASGITDTFYTATNLNIYTQYSFAVRSECDSGDYSDFSNTVSGITDCGSYSVPYTWNFDTGPSWNECWKKVGSNNCTMGYHSVTHSGGRMLKLLGYNSIVALPWTEDDIKYLQLRCWLRPEDESNPKNGSFSIGYITDVTNPSTFVATASFQQDDFRGYEEKTALFIGAPTGARIAMKIKTYNSSIAWFVDDVTIEAAPPCLPPVNLAYESEDTYAVLSWKGNSTSYNIYSITDTDTTFLSTVNGTSTVLTGLSDLTEYTYGITAICDSVESDMAFIKNGQSLPFFEDFEENSSTASIWTNVGPGAWHIGVGDCYTIGNQSAYSGNLNAHICHAHQGDRTKFVSPVLINADHITLTFAHKHLKWLNDIDTLKVLYRSSLNDSWHQVANAEYFNNCSWTVSSVNINDIVYQIAFEMSDGYGWGVAVDSVVVQYNPYYPRVLDVTVDTVEINSVTISWTGTSTSYLVYNGDSCVAEVSDTSFTFTGLEEGTRYTLGVRAFNESDTCRMVTVSIVTKLLERMRVSVSVNDPSMGTTNPAPGIRYIKKGDTASVVAHPNQGFFLREWDVTATYDGAPYLDTTFLNPSADVFDMISDSPWVVQSGDQLYNFNVKANFYVDSVWLTITVNDTTRGTTDPAPGHYHLHTGDYVTVVAIPYEGYELSMWSSGDTTATVTLLAEYDKTLSAFFARKQGIGDVEAANINAYGKDGDIVLLGAEGREIYLLDISGRVLYHTASASSLECYSVPVSGVYILRIVGVGNKRVVVVR